MGWALELGPFVLEHPIGRGGMGEVWLAHHRGDDVPVAIKVLTDAGAADPAFVAAFRDEVRAVAALDHPAIVRVFDYGVIPDPPPRDDAGNTLPADSPYLAMELLDGGTLKEHCGKLGWEEIQALLLGLLDALAHAHARGVIHRDLKPANVLLGSSPRDVRLVDFGLAHLLRGQEIGPQAPERKVRGTPAYMAPEQWRGDWRASGPWTDLYAVGCLGWALATGEPPFGKKGTPQRLAEAHCYAEPPPLRAGMSVPEGFESWLRRLLDKSARYRFRRAADAAWSLQDLYSASSSDSFFLSDSDFAGLDPNADPDETFDLKSATHTLVLEPSAGRAEAWTSVRTRWLMDRDDSALAPIPLNWRRPVDVQPPRRLVGVGLGLYGLRSVPMVDREPERDGLWRTLREVRDQHRARGIVLRGPAGTGKSRLARWLCERGHELGATSVLRALHGPIAGPVDGLAAMVARDLGTVGLEREEVEDRLSDLSADPGVLHSSDLDALIELVCPGAEGDRSSSSLPAGEELHLLLARYCALRAQDRCLVLWLDDVQWGWEALGFALHLLAGRGVPFPLLIVATVNDDVLRERPAEASRLDRLERLPGVTPLSVGPLPVPHRAAMVDALLALDAPLAAEVARRTEGNPLFAVQLVGDWVHQGMLRPGPAGFALAPDADPRSFPDTLHAIWGRRLERVLRDRPPTDGVALEIAATLGLQVARSDWLVACNEAEATPSPGLLEALLSQRLARREGSAAEADWAFVHGMLRESLERRAREGGRWPGHNAACAAMLEGRMDPRAGERRGRHLLEAEQVLEALPLLEDGARLRMAAGEYTPTAALLDLREAAMHALPLPDDDVAWVRGHILRARLERVSGDPDLALHYARRAQTGAAAANKGALQARAIEEVARLTNVMGDPSRAASLMAVACSLADGAAEPVLAAQCRLARGEILLQGGALGEADRELQTALAAFDAHRELIGASRCRLALGSIARGRGDFHAGEQWLRTAEELCVRAGSRIGVAQCRHARGENARAAGDPTAAEPHYAAALAIFEALGSRDQVHCRVNGALCLLQLGRPGEARRALEKGLEECELRRLRTIAAAVRVFLLPCYAADDDWAAWDATLPEALEGLDSFTDVDVGTMARMAGAMALQAGKTSRALAVLRLARTQWDTLGRRDQVEAVDALIGQATSRGSRGT